MLNFFERVQEFFTIIRYFRYNSIYCYTYDKMICNNKLILYDNKLLLFVFDWDIDLKQCVTNNNQQSFFKLLVGI